MKAWTLAVLFGLVSSLAAGEKSAPDAGRGEKALLTRSYNPAPWPLPAYQNSWKFWQPAPKEKPKDYDQAFRDYYGLHPAPFENAGYPMGLREGYTLIFKGLTNDCLLCHGGSIHGKSYVGLGNSSLDLQSLFEDLAQASGRSPKLPFTFSQVRGTSEAGAMAVFLLSYRNPDLSIRLNPHAFDLRDDLCEDVPAWWLLHKKQTMYFTGSTPAQSVRSIMQFMLSPTNSREVFDKEEKNFADIQAYILSLRPPKYPYPIDETLAERGRGLFDQHCAKCHGTYGEKWTYPNKIIPIETIGTDRTRLDGIPHATGELYNRSWFAQEKGEDGYKVTSPKGYQAPPLDGIWATAPYFHNGSVPTLHGVLDSKSRPKIFTRSFRTDEESYDRDQVGWKVEELSKKADPQQPGVLRRRVYDTTEPGRGNGGHTFGDFLKEDERRAVIEYLKKL